MKRLHILVEGQTEEVITDRLIRPFLEDANWIVSFSVLTTKRTAGGANSRGGVSAWSKIEKEVRLLLGSQFDLVTTLLDYYGFPSDAPGMQDRPTGHAHDRVTYVEGQLQSKIGDIRFVPHLVLHETEAWVFAAANQLSALMDNDPSLATELTSIAQSAGGPELVNDGPTTAPSKRLLDRAPTYQKTLHGPLAIEELGLKDLRAQCPHLDTWLTLLTSRG
jgi:hypothetical protein